MLSYFTCVQNSCFKFRYCLSYQYYFSNNLCSPLCSDCAFNVLITDKGFVFVFVFFLGDGRWWVKICLDFVLNLFFYHYYYYFRFFLSISYFLFFSLILTQNIMVILFLISILTDFCSNLSNHFDLVFDSDSGFDFGQL